MIAAVERAVPAGVASDSLFEVRPDGVADASDFSFLVIGDPGEGDPSQASLRDRYLLLGQRPDVRFLVISSDVIYPDGAARDYEFKFYLPFKGFEKSIYAIPGNHDWYSALDGFAANLMEPVAARAAMDAREALTALVTPLCVDASPAAIPVCWNAHWRHSASSAWNCSNALPVPGSTMTLGPVGKVTHPVMSRDRPTSAASTGPRRPGIGEGC
jgi:hypothetical protein